LLRKALYKLLNKHLETPVYMAQPQVNFRKEAVATIL